MAEEDKLRAEWFWTDRWMGSSAFLLPQEPRGVYREMLTQAWMRGARLPNDHEAIRRATGTSLEEWDRCWPRLARYWRVDGDYLVNDTQLEVYAEAQNQRGKASERARVAAERRWAKERERAEADARASTRAHARASAQALRGQCPPYLSPSPNTTTPPLTPPANGGGSNGNGHHPSTDVLRRERKEARQRIEDQVEQARQFALGGGYRLARGWKRAFRDWFERGCSLASVQEGIEKGEHLPARKL